MLQTNLVVGLFHTKVWYRQWHGLEHGYCSAGVGCRGLDVGRCSFVLSETIKHPGALATITS